MTFDLVHCLIVPLTIICQTDYKWQLLSKILNIFELQKTKKTMFFSTKISHVVEDTERSFHAATSM
ncbi:hypothetical protein DRP05_00275 [Archaeoglobales archaeon]|nr:MAG: hypothetical protein DRP05_00275 [Archaeoglobales archaeon]